MDWLNGVLIVVSAACFPAALYRYFVKGTSSVEYFINDMRNRRLRRDEIKHLARMHTAVLGDETTAHLIKAGRISNKFAANRILLVNPISEMNRMNPALVPTCGLVYVGAMLVLGKKCGWVSVCGISYTMNMIQLEVYEKNSGCVYGDMRQSQTFRSMKIDKLYGNK